MKRQTSFGTMEILSKEPLIEKMTFEKEGRSHKHDKTEYCYVLEGSGKIIGAKPEKATKGELRKIPPGTAHWMIPEEKPFKLLIFYSDR